MEIIDSHVHLYPPEINRAPAAWAAARGEAHWALLCTRVRKNGRPVQTFPDTATLLRAMDAAGVARAILQGWYWETAESCALQNTFYAECIRLHPDRLSACAAIHPRAGAARVRDEIRRAADSGFVGLGELSPHSQNIAADDPALHAAFALAGELNLAVNLHVTESASGGVIATGGKARQGSGVSGRAVSPKPPARPSWGGRLGEPSLPSAAARPACHQSQPHSADAAGAAGAADTADGARAARAVGAVGAVGAKNYPGKIATPLGDFVAWAQAHPRTRFVLAHWGARLPLDPAHGAAARAAKNIFYDTAASPLIYGAEHSRALWREMTAAADGANGANGVDGADGADGASRILFGTDYPLVLYPEKRDCGLSGTGCQPVILNAPTSADDSPRAGSPCHDKGNRGFQVHPKNETEPSMASLADEARASGLSERDLAAIFSENARRVYALVSRYRNHTPS